VNENHGENLSTLALMMVSHAKEFTNL